MVHGVLLFWFGLETIEVSDSDKTAPVQLATFIGDRFDYTFESRVDPF